jgi:anti-sigma factor RsiW
MNCPDGRTLERGIAGQLPEAEQAALERHLARCDACRREVAFLQAVRLVAAQPDPGGDHLSDEALAALVDGALDATQHERALRHLAGCPDCLAAAAALQRALSEVGSEPTHSPPAALLERATARGAASRSAAAAEPPPAAAGGWLDKLFGAGFGWRLGLAAGAAAVVLLASVVLIETGPGPEPAGPAITDAPRLAANGPRPPAATPEPTADPTHPTHPGEPVEPADRTPPDAAATAVADAEPDSAAAHDTRPGAAEPHRPEADPAQPARSQATLAARVQPAARPPEAPLGRALDSRAPGPGFGDGYALGRALDFLERFGPWLERSPAIRQRVAATLQALGPALESALGPGERRQRLVRFAAELGRSLTAGDIAAQAAARRLAVLCQALREALADRSPAADGLRLGLLVQGWKTAADARRLGLESEAAPDAAAIERARAIIRRQPSLATPSQQAALANLERIERLTGEPPAVRRSDRILQQIGQLDAHLIRSH